MINVLYVSAAGERGGLEVVLLNILKCLDRSRFSPQVVLLEDGPFVREVQQTGTAVQVVQSGRVRELWRGGKAVAGVVKLIRSQKTHIVHSHNAKAHMYGGLAAAITGVPSILHLHGVPKLTFSRDGIVNLVSLTVPARYTLACSAFVAEAFRRAWHSSRKVGVIHNGTVEPLPAVHSLSETRQGLGIPANAPVVVMVSRLQRWKGVHVFVDAAALVRRNNPEAHFIVVGGSLFGLEKEYAPALTRQVEQLGLEHLVHFVGHQSDVFQFYMTADVVVQCSIEPEPFGMVLVEAMTCGKPVVATRIGATREIVEEGATGLLVRPGDAEHLARALETLLSDPHRRLRMGQAAATRVRDRFSARRMVTELQALYGQIVGDGAQA